MSLNSKLTTEAGADVVEHDGRFFITIGRPGFNCRANNLNGFATEEAAKRMIASRTVWRCAACGAATSIGDKPVARSACRCLS